MSATLTPYDSSALTRPVDEIGAMRIAEDRAAHMLPSATQAFSPELTALLCRLKPGQRLRITQTVRVGRSRWQAVVTGKFRQVDYLVTGLATERVPQDEVVVVAVHFTKDNGELSSVTLDENSRIEVLE